MVVTYSASPMLHLMTPPVTSPFPSTVTEPLSAAGSLPSSSTPPPRKFKVKVPESIAFDAVPLPQFSAWATPTWPAATTAVAASATNMTLNLVIVFPPLFKWSLTNCFSYRKDLFVSNSGSKLPHSRATLRRSKLFREVIRQDLRRWRAGSNAPEVAPAFGQQRQVAASPDLNGSRNPRLQRMRKKGRSLLLRAPCCISVAGVSCCHIHLGRFR